MPFCRDCGKEIPASAAFCTHCGKSQQTSSPPPRKNIGDDAGVRLLIPVGRSGWAIASGYLALFSILLIPAPFALITGLLAVRDIRHDSNKHGMGRAIFGIIMGVLGSGFLLFAFARKLHFI